MKRPILQHLSQAILCYWRPLLVLALLIALPATAPSPELVLPDAPRYQPADTPSMESPDQ